MYPGADLSVTFPLLLLLLLVLYMCVYRALGRGDNDKPLLVSQGRSVPFGSPWGRRRRQVSDGRASPSEAHDEHYYGGQFPGPVERSWERASTVPCPPPKKWSAAQPVDCAALHRRAPIVLPYCHHSLDLLVPLMVASCSSSSRSCPRCRAFTLY